MCVSGGGEGGRRGKGDFSTITLGFHFLVKLELLGKEKKTCKNIEKWKLGKCNKNEEK